MKSYVFIAIGFLSQPCLTRHRGTDAILQRRRILLAPQSRTIDFGTRVVLEKESTRPFHKVHFSLVAAAATLPRQQR